MDGLDSFPQLILRQQDELYLLVPDDETGAAALYRVRRFEQISGRSLASTEGLSQVWLALRAATLGG